MGESSGESLERTFANWLPMVQLVLQERLCKLVRVKTPLQLVLCLMRALWDQLNAGSASRKI